MWKRFKASGRILSQLSQLEIGQLIYAFCAFILFFGTLFHYYFMLDTGWQFLIETIFHTCISLNMYNYWLIVCQLHLLVRKMVHLDDDAYEQSIDATGAKVLAFLLFMWLWDRFGAWFIGGFGQCVYFMSNFVLVFIILSILVISGYQLISYVLQKGRHEMGKKVGSRMLMHIIIALIMSLACLYFASRNLPYLIVPASDYVYKTEDTTFIANLAHGVAFTCMGLLTWQSYPPGMSLRELLNGRTARVAPVKERRHALVSL
jgi:hypothetical protein